MRTLCLVCAATIASLLATGCSDRDADELTVVNDSQVFSMTDIDESSSSASVQTTTAQTASSENNESFDFDNAVKSIGLFGKTISMPCKVSELSEGFTVEKKITYDRNGIEDLKFELMYNGALIGSGIIEDCSVDEEDISNKRIVNLELCVEQYSYPHYDSELKWLEAAGIYSGFIELEFAGLDFLSSPEDIRDVMGIPHNVNDLYADEDLLGTWYVMTYEYESGSISFEFKNETELRGIEIDVVQW